MHSRFRKTAVIAIFALGVSSVLAGCRHRHRHDPEKVRKVATWIVEDALDDLDATDEQRTAIHASKDRILAEGMKLHAESKKAHEAIYQEWNQEEPDAERVHALIDERIEAFRVVAHEAADEALATHALLTPEQRALVAERMREHMDED